MRSGGKMKIRQLYAYELRPAAALVMETYSRMEQPYVANPKEIEDFKRYADEDHLWVESCKNKLFLFGAFDDNDQMCAVGAIDAAGAVTLLYAGLNFQHRGLEAEVLREMEEFATVGRSIAREEIKIPEKWMQYTATAGAPEQSFCDRTADRAGAAVVCDRTADRAGAAVVCDRTADRAGAAVVCDRTADRAGAVVCDRAAAYAGAAGVPESEHRIRTGLWSAAISEHGVWTGLRPAAESEYGLRTELRSAVLSEHRIWTGVRRELVSRQHLPKEPCSAVGCAGDHRLCRAACDRAGVHSFHAVNRTVQDTLTWNESSAEAYRDGADGSYTEDDTEVEDTGEEREVLELADSLGKDFCHTG